MIPRYRGVVTRFDENSKRWVVKFSHENHPFSGKEFAVGSVHEDIVLAEGVEVEFVLTSSRTGNGAPLTKAIDVKPISPLVGSSAITLSSEASTELEQATKDSWLKSIAEEISKNFEDSGGGSSKHRFLQEFLKKVSEEKGWHAVLEKGINDGKIDLFLQKGGSMVGVEISVSTSPQHELGNIKKCLEVKCHHVVSVSLDTQSVAKVRKFAEKHLSPDQLRQVEFLLPEEVPAFLDKIGGGIIQDIGMVKGYKVKVIYVPVSPEEAEKKQKAIASIIGDSHLRSRRREMKKSAVQ